MNFTIAMQLIQHPVSLKATALGFVIYYVLVIVPRFAVRRHFLFCIFLIQG